MNKKLLLNLAIGAVLLIHVSTYAQVDLSQGLVMHLPLDGNANDVSGNGNNGTVYGAVPTTNQAGTPNTAMQFDGVDDDIVIPATARNGGFNSYSFCAKVMPISFYSGACFGNSLFSKDINDVSGGVDFEFNPNLFYSSCNHPFDTSHQIFTSWVGTNAVNTINTAVQPSQNYINTNQWYCLVYTLDVITGSHKIYVNGILYVDTVLTGLAPLNSTEDIYLGHVNDPIYPYWLNAKLDEVRFYDRALNAQEVVAYCDFSPCDTIADFSYTVNCQEVSFRDASISDCAAIANWEWDFGDGNTANGTVAPTHAYASYSTYTVVLRIYDDIGNLLDTTSQSVEVNPLLTVDAGSDASICAGGSIQLHATSAAPNTRYTWLAPGSATLSDPTMAKPIASPSTTTTYTVVVTDDVSGCSDTDDVVVSVVEGDCCVPFIPNAFTPNDDGKNDFLEIYNLEEMEYLSVKIYNRWGQEIYRDYNRLHWDGKFKGKPVDIGVYHMTITYNCVGLGTENKEYVGEVHLIR